MGTGYTRNDTANNIADGNIINASDLDGEFDAVQSAFDASTGHTHDGTAGEGAPIETIGPSQDVVATASVLRPKTDNTVDLGTTSLEYKDLFLDGTAHIDTLDVDENASITGTLGVTGTTTLGTANITTGTITTADINGGNIDGTIIGATTAAAITGTTITGTSFVTSGDMTFGDNDKAIFGAGSDLQIYHDGSHSYVSDQGTGNIKILADDFIVKNAADTETMIQAFTDSAVSLWYDNASKLATTSTGVDVTGTVTADGLTVDGDLAVSSANSRIRLFETDTTDLNTQLQNQAGDFNIARLDDDAGGSTVQLNIDHATGNVSIPSGNVGIGTTSPSDLLELSGSTAQPAIRLTDSDVSGLYHRIFTPTNTGLAISADTGNVAADSFIRLDVDGTEKMRIDSSGRLLLGNTDGSYASANADNIVMGDRTSSAESGITFGSTLASSLRFADAGAVGQGIIQYVHDDTVNTDYMNFYTAATERMRIDSSGRVGIGTSSPSRQLHLSGSGANTRLRVENTTGSNVLDVYAEDGGNSTLNYTSVLTMSQSGTERMRIDSSGNVLVGKSVTTQNTAGTQISASSGVRATVDGNVATILNRTTSDGDIALFRKDGTTVGSIASRGGVATNLILRTATGQGAGIGGANSGVLPCDEDGLQDDEINLGASGTRWKDLYLSGTGYVGTSLGIGTSSPTGKLSVSDPTYLSSTATLGSSITLNSENTTSWLGTRELISFESVGNGADHRTGTLSVKLKKGASDTTLTEYMQINAVSNYTTFSTVGSERMRIDGSGNLLVGMTTASTNNDGAGIRADGLIHGKRAEVVATFNRKTSNGTIVELAKDNTVVGSIGTNGNLYIQGPTGTSGAEFANNAVRPWKDGARVDATVDLGVSAGRFKDLYLSSSIILQRAESASVGTFGRNTDGTARTLFTFRSESQNATVGTITVTNSTTAYNTSSDYRLKTDAQPMTGATDRLKQLNPVNFEWIADGTRVDGFLAHEAQAVVPEAVTGTKDAMRDEEYEVTPAVTDDDGNVTTEAVMGTRSVPDYQGIDQSKLVPLLVATIKELEARITALENA